MSLLKFFWNELVSAPVAPDDPLAHCEIAAMSQREIADLPLGFPKPKPTRFEVARCA